MFCCKSKSNLAGFSTKAGIFAVVQRPQDILGLSFVTWMTTTDATRCHPQREATRTTATPTPTEHSIAYALVVVT